MARRVEDVRRLGWLDGLRGVAAMQVVLLHSIFGFLPAVGSAFPLKLDELWWRGLATAPAIFLYDGSAAVYLFFIMSGVALTYAFAAHPLGFLPNVTRRAIRLGLPMAGATLLAAALYALWPRAHGAAGMLTHSPWLAGIGPSDITLGVIAHQIAFEGLFAGFDGWSLLPVWITRNLDLAESARGFDTPLWTLHIEFCGSLLVMLLVAVRASASKVGYRATCGVLGAAFVLSPLVLFLIGHLAAPHLSHAGGRGGRAVLGTILLAAGVLLCALRVLPPIAALWSVLPPPPLGIQGDQAILQKTIGSVLVFGGIALLPAVRSRLQRPVCRWLGRISFSLYLVHLPLQSTCVAAGFLVLQRSLPYPAAVALACVTGILASLTLAIAFERWIDRTAIRLSHATGRWRFRPKPAALAAIGDSV